MANQTQIVAIEMTDEEIKNSNRSIVDFQQNAMINGRKELGRLQKKLAITYWVIIGLSIIMFIIGIGLLSVPVWTAFKGKLEVFNSLVTGGLGIADLAALFFFRPIERIHKLMGDMSQVFLALNNYQSQVALRLLEMNIKDRKTISVACDNIGKAAENCIKWIEEYFEKVKK